MQPWPNVASTADNHRPALSSDTAPDTAHLKKSAKNDSYNLGFDDQGDKYQYNGVRTTDDGNYVLIFDPARKAFVLHRVDSTFHMNITRTPTDSNAESLRKQFPQLEVKSPSTKLPKGKAAGKAGPGKAASAKAKGGRNAAEETPKAKSSTQSEKNKPVALTLPDLSAPPTKKSEPSASQSEQEKKPKRPALSPVESEEDDDDDDGGLTVEYPEGNPAAFRSSSQFMPTIPVVTRRFSEFADERESEEDDFDTKMTGGYDVEEGYEEEEYEEEEEEEPSRQPLSPARNSRPEMPPAEEPDRYTFDDGDEDEEDLGDLEAELMREFDKAQVEGHESDSSVSEEE